MHCTCTALHCTAQMEARPYLIRVKVVRPQARNGFHIRCIKRKDTLVEIDSSVRIIEHIVNTCNAQHQTRFGGENVAEK